jgi:hypothetical protein
MLSMILTVAKDLLGSFEQPTILHSFVDDTWDTSFVYEGLYNITITQVSLVVILGSEHRAFCEVKENTFLSTKKQFHFTGRVDDTD